MKKGIKKIGRGIWNTLSDAGKDMKQSFKTFDKASQPRRIKVKKKIKYIRPKLKKPKSVIEIFRF